MEKLFGVWELLSFKLHALKISFCPFGKEPKGMLIYTPNGHMTVQIMNPKRKLLNPNTSDLGEGTNKEMAHAYRGYVAYYGTYEINEKDKSIIHHVQSNLIPNEVGKDFVRYYEFDNDHLVLKTPPMKFIFLELTGTLVWNKTALIS